MTTLTKIGRTLALQLLAPGDLACNAMGIIHEDGRGLLRMLVNAVVWLIVGIAIAFQVA